AGIVSAKARNINILNNNDGSSIESFIQTDAAVNRGNSGGALVNTRGELIGINAAIASGTGYYAGYSFAIPANIARKVAHDLMQFGEVQRAYIGIQIREVDASLADEKGLDQPRGVYVAGVIENSSASKAGLKVGDVIVGIQGNSINSYSELQESVAQYSPGDEITIQVLRTKDPVDLKVVLTNESGTTARVKREESESLSDLGVSLRPVDPETAHKLGINQGAEIYELRSGKLSGIGIRKGFIITRIDRKPVRSADDIRKLLKPAQGGVLIEGVYPNGVRAYYGLGF
ncbi:MAG: deoxyribonuclease HsdR, partial [Bacteroidetes bacterium HGW-Bacteroidetes-22]